MLLPDQVDDGLGAREDLLCGVNSLEMSIVDIVRPGQQHGHFGCAHKVEFAIL